MLDIAAYGIYIGILVYAAIMDWRTLRISNKLVIAIMLDWLVWQILRDVLPRLLPNLRESSLLVVLDTPDVSAASGVLAAIALGAGLTLFVLAYEAVTHKYSMGGGDIKLMAASALFLGMQRSLIALMIACVAAVLIAPAYSRACKQRRDWKRQRNFKRQRNRRQRRNRIANVSRETFSCRIGEVSKLAFQDGTHAEALHSGASHPRSSRSEFSHSENLNSAALHSEFLNSANPNVEPSPSKSLAPENSHSAVAHGFPFGPAIAIGSVAALFL